MWMHDERQDAMWDHTAAIRETTANCSRDSKKHPQPFKVADFHPTRSRHKTEPLRLPMKDTMAVMKKAFVGEK
jgi:hypothetical protein